MKAVAGAGHKHSLPPQGAERGIRKSGRRQRGFCKD